VVRGGKSSSNCSSKAGETMTLAMLNNIFWGPSYRHNLSHQYLKL
jgi:hypothetical protein